MKKPELLSPAGNMECLVAAIEAGCDAVYLGGKTFGARSFAGNFSNDEMINAINYAHLYGVKVYVTANTLVYDCEVDEFLNYIDFLHQNNVDAIILQDLGMLDLLRKTYPNLELHASTQMHIHNLEGVRFAEEMGIKRVVLARETNYELLKEIRENTNMELEIFIHGALCMCYSGQCLMSAMLTNRSGNRGTCSQPCRMKYDLFSDSKKINTDNYLLSTKDLNTILNIDKLIDIGIDSLKIEGRMKRQEYVYLITSLYRKAIDNYLECGKTLITDNDMKELKKIFNREFTKGFLFNEDNDSFTNEYRPNHMGIPIGKIIGVNKYRIKIKLTDELNQGDGIRIINEYDNGGIVNKIYKDGKLVNSATDIVEIDNNYQVNVGNVVLKTTDIKQLNNIDLLLKKRQRKVKIDGYLECFIGKPIKLILSDEKNKVEVLGNIVEKSNKIEMQTNEISKQICKLGNTVYEMNELIINRDKNIFIRISELNELRRLASTKLDNIRMYNTNYKKEKYSISLDEYNEKRGYSYLINNKDDLKNLKDYKYIYTENRDLLNNDIIYKLPRVIEKNIEKGNFLCSEIGSLWYNKSYSDFSLNIVNSYAVAFLHSMGVKRITLSYELSLDQISELINNYIKRYNMKPNLELIVSSYPELMVTKYNLLKKYNLNNGYLKDINNRKYKIINKNNLTYIKNYRKIIYDNDVCFNIGVNTLRIEMSE